MTHSHVLTIDGGEAPALRVYAELPSHEGAAVSDFAAGPAGELWLLQRVAGGQRLLRYEGGRWSPLAISRLSGPLITITVDRQGRLWASAGYLVFRATDSGILRDLDTLEVGDLPITALDFLAEGDGLVLARGDEQLLRLDGEGAVIERSELGGEVRGHELRQAVNESGSVILGNDACALRLLGAGAREWTPDGCHWLGALALANSGRMWLDTDEGLVALSADGGILARSGRPDSVVDLALTGEGPPFDEGPPRDRLGPTGTLPSLGPAAPRGYSLQLASKSSQEAAEAARDRVLARLEEEVIELPAHVLHRGELWVVMLGDYEDEERAEVLRPFARLLLGEGAVVREMSKFCSSATVVARGVSRCGGPGSRAEGATRLRASELTHRQDPLQPKGRLTMPPVRLAAAERPRERPTRPPATQLALLVAKPDPGALQHRPDRIEYQSWLWRPTGPGDPDDPGATGGTEPERRSGVLVAEGSSWWELRVSTETLELPLCPCGDRGPVESDEQIELSATVIETRREGTEEWRTLLGTEAYPQSCVPAREDFTLDHTLVSVAGSRIFVVQDLAYNECGLHPEHRTQLLIREPEGGRVLATDLLAELPPRPLEDALRELSLELQASARDDGVEPTQGSWWPHDLDFLALFPAYDRREARATLVYGLEVAYTESRGWSDYLYAERGSVVLDDMSSLYPPEDVQHLLAKVDAEGGVVIGWSRQLLP
ncbi:SPOR domain-containing protein [Pseudenhygromyxa sp. WMMC2535]|uniref:SPOR domain-containing protein n=1 Tax=Pseudenhygromyxa sp. WMMC2535 TaxID=2712867 RepID=UPI0015961BCD|nr:SPOR domain-containing protein [Pseudenhygromyxa sp. WMMC2535]NVB43589.1 SPOR domain-containing protein [Pseudenhygromyxa sp. WMMC2535]